MAWYKHASKYGESYRKPAGCLFFILVLFAVLYPLLGLKPMASKVQPPQPISGVRTTSAAGPHFELSYGYYVRYGIGDDNREWLGPFTYLGNSFLTALNIMGFQRDLAYEPSYPWGRLLALLELLLTSTLIALFLLAVRRQFRR